MTIPAKPTATKPETKAPPSSFVDALAVYLQPRVLIVLFLGFSAGLPLALSGSTLRVWMREAGIDLGTIGLLALLQTPYTLKFLWAPLLDALDVPVLSRLLGRRRGWLLLSQMLLMAAILFLAGCNPVSAPGLVAFAALLVAAASATQDIVIDAFRVESLAEREQAAGMASYVAAYRIGTLVSTAGALYLVSALEGFDFGKPSAWMWSYIAMAAIVLIGMITTVFATEPEKSAVAVSDHAAHAKDGPFLRVISAAVGAFRDFLDRGAGVAAAILAFVVLYKFTDALAGIMTESFVLDLGFSRNEYATIIKGVGLAATLAGGFAGGFIARAYPLATSLWIGGALQAAANFAFSYQSLVGHNVVVLTFAITVENFTSAIGTVIFVAYISALCANPLHTATQYALLTALAAVGRTYLSAGSGYIADAAGWTWFFVICAAAGVPGLLLLWVLQRIGHFKRLG
ncbi:MAG TPA: MFS transporter [Xanthobacteraceae bacterium]|jgi:PAT family beta-lactamase induction signal transducer AmpG|nr:MFS transporter [Xanthobacteraceae bacterium]